MDSQTKDKYPNLSTSIREKIDYLTKPTQFWEFPLWNVTVIGVVAGIARTIMQLKTDWALRSTGLGRDRHMCLQIFRTNTYS